MSSECFLFLSQTSVIRDEFCPVSRKCFESFSLGTTEEFQMHVTRCFLPRVPSGVRDPPNPLVTRVLRPCTVWTPPRATTTPCNSVMSPELKWGGLNPPRHFCSHYRTHRWKGTNTCWVSTVHYVLFTWDIPLNSLSIFWVVSWSSFSKS